MRCPRRPQDLVLVSWFPVLLFPALFPCLSLPTALTSCVGYCSFFCYKAADKNVSEGCWALHTLVLLAATAAASKVCQAWQGRLLRLVFDTPVHPLHTQHSNQHGWCLTITPQHSTPAHFIQPGTPKTPLVHPALCYVRGLGTVCHACAYAWSCDMACCWVLPSNAGRDAASVWVCGWWFCMHARVCCLFLLTDVPCYQAAVPAVCWRCVFVC